jgi:hypothetical protein
MLFPLKCERCGRHASLELTVIYRLALQRTLCEDCWRGVLEVGEVVVYKYSFRVQVPTFQLALPVGARIVHVGLQHGVPCLWAELDPSRPLEERRFKVMATGEIFDESARHVGTFFADSGRFVWHLYELPVERA